MDRVLRVQVVLKGVRSSALVSYDILVGDLGCAPWYNIHVVSISFQLLNRKLFCPRPWQLLWIGIRMVCTEDVLNLVDCLLLFHVSLSQAFQNLLLVTFKFLRFAVFLSDLDNLILDDLVLLLSNLGPLLSGDSLDPLSDFLLLGFDLGPVFLKLLGLFCLVLSQTFCVLNAFFLDGLSLLQLVHVHFLSALSRVASLIRHDWVLTSHYRRLYWQNVLSSRLHCKEVGCWAVFLLDHGMLSL